MELIDTRQLKTFQLLARTGSFTEAAKQMFVTQSAVSHAMKALESSLDQKLLDRVGKRVALTAAGEVLLAHAESILTEMQVAVDELKAMSLWGYSRLRVGATDTMCQHLLPPVLREFRDSFPNCEVSIQSADTEELVGMLAQGDIDLAIAILPAGEVPGCEILPLFKDELVFAVPPTHPWACGTPVEVDLAEQWYLIYARRSPTYQLVTKHFKRMGLHAPQKLELGNMEGIREMAKSGMGVGVIAPWVIENELNEGSLVAVSPPGEMPLIREWGILVRGGEVSEGSVVTDAFKGICQTVSRGFKVSA